VLKAWFFAPGILGNLNAKPNYRCAYIHPGPLDLVFSGKHTFRNKPGFFLSKTWLIMEFFAWWKSEKQAKTWFLTVKKLLKT
jgi:hypothetical protein